MMEMPALALLHCVPLHFNLQSGEPRISVPKIPLLRISCAVRRVEKGI